MVPPERDQSDASPHAQAPDHVRSLIPPGLQIQNVLEIDDLPEDGLRGPGGGHDLGRALVEEKRERLVATRRPGTGRENAREATAGFSVALGRLAHLPLAPGGLAVARVPIERGAHGPLVEIGRAHV